MQVFALFPTIHTLEHAITHIKDMGISSQDIFVVPVKEPNEILPVDKRYPKDKDWVDKGFAFAAAFSVIAAGIGFKLTLGPIIWGLIGALVGFLFGWFISHFNFKKQGRLLTRKHPRPPIILIVNCEEKSILFVEKALYEKGALGVNTPLKKSSSTI